MRKHRLVLIGVFELLRASTDCFEVKAMASTRRDCLFILGMDEGRSTRLTRLTTEAFFSPRLWLANHDGATLHGLQLLTMLWTRGLTPAL